MLVGVASIAFHCQRERPEGGQASHVYSKVDGAKNALHGSNRSMNPRVRITRGRKRIDRAASSEFAFATHQKSPRPKLGYRTHSNGSDEGEHARSPGRKSYPFLYKSARNSLNSRRAKRSVKPSYPLCSKILDNFDIFNGLVTHFIRRTVIRCYTAGRPN